MQVKTTAPSFAQDHRRQLDDAPHPGNFEEFVKDCARMADRKAAVLRISSATQKTIELYGKGLNLAEANLSGLDLSGFDLREFYVKIDLRN